MDSFRDQLIQRIQSIGSKLDVVGNECQDTARVFNATDMLVHEDHDVSNEGTERMIVVAKVFLEGETTRMWCDILERSCSSSQDLGNAMLGDDDTLVERVMKHKNDIVKEPYAYESKDFVGIGFTYRHKFVLHEICQRIIDKCIWERRMNQLTIDAMPSEEYHAMWQNTWVSIVGNDDDIESNEMDFLGRNVRTRCMYTMMVGMVLSDCFGTRDVKNIVERTVCNVCKRPIVCHDIHVVAVGPKRATALTLYNLEPSLRRLCALIVMMSSGTQALEFAYRWYTNNLMHDDDDDDDMTTLVAWDRFRLQKACDVNKLLSRELIDSVNGLLSMF